MIWTIELLNWNLRLIVYIEVPSALLSMNTLIGKFKKKKKEKNPYLYFSRWGIVIWKTQQWIWNPKNIHIRFWKLFLSGEKISDIYYLEDLDYTKNYVTSLKIIVI